MYIGFITQGMLRYGCIKRYVSQSISSNECSASYILNECSASYIHNECSASYIPQSMLHNECHTRYVSQGMLCTVCYTRYVIKGMLSICMISKIWRRGMFIMICLKLYVIFYVLPHDCIVCYTISTYCIIPWYMKSLPDNFPPGAS